VSFAAKLALFWLAVQVGLRLLRAAPGSLLSRLAFTWFGPVPREGERRSDFLLRNACFALGWLMQVTIVAALMVLLGEAVPALAANDVFFGLCGFAISIGAGMALLGALLAALGALKARTLGPDHVWRAPLGVPADEDDVEPSDPPQA